MFPDTIKRFEDVPSAPPHSAVRSAAAQRVTCAALAVALFVCAPAVFADPVRLVTSGHVSQLVEDGETGFSFEGAGFRFSGGEVNWFPAETCTPCTPGTSLDLSSTMTVRADPPGTATIDGRTYDTVFFTGAFDFDAGRVTVPHVPVGGPGARPVTSFTFTGTLAGYADPSRTRTPLFSTPLAGAGTASIGFFHLPSNSGIHTDGFNYEFDNSAPTPEPGSLFLFGSGAAWVASRWRTRRGAAPAC